jgi:hypothetical protein
MLKHVLKKNNDFIENQNNSLHQLSIATSQCVHALWSVVTFNISPSVNYLVWLVGFPWLFQTTPRISE